jgi:hypothetical protein
MPAPRGPSSGGLNSAGSSEQLPHYLLATPTVTTLRTPNRRLEGRSWRAAPVQLSVQTELEAKASWSDRPPLLLKNGETYSTIRPPEFSELETFVLAIEEGSIARAAGRLRISAPAAAKRIRQLEALAHSPLLIRGRRGVTATETGARLYPAEPQCASRGRFVHRLRKTLSRDSRTGVPTPVRHPSSPQAAPLLVQS